MPSEEAIVLAGGFGTRLQAVVSDVPKPLAPVAGRPFLAWLLDRLANQGIRRCILATGHMADVVERTLGAQWRGMALAYSPEAQPLGTGGAIRQARDLLHGDAVHVLNGDTWLDYDLPALEAATHAAQAAIGIALARVADVARYGAVEVASGRVRGFREKGEAGPGWINGGAYFLAPAALVALGNRGTFSFEREVLEPGVARGQVAALTETSGFIDIGIPGDYLRAQSWFVAQA